MQDNEIISLFEIRDEHAIEALSDKYHPYCYKIAWNLLTNKEDSEECLNDTWFSVWSLIPPKKPSALSHFCGRITRNLPLKISWRRKNCWRSSMIFLEKWMQRTEIFL